MTTRVIFNAEKKIKERAMKEAKKQGVSLSYFLNQALAEVASGEKKVEIVEQVNEKTLKRLQKAYEEIKQGKNLSPKFANVEEGLTWLAAK